MTTLVETGLRIMRFVGAALLFPYIISHRPGPDDLSLPLDQWVSAVSICGSLMLVNAMSLVSEGADQDRIRRVTGVVGLIADTLSVMLIVNVLGIFDENVSWFILIIPIIEAAMRYGIGAAVGTWLAMTAITITIARLTGQSAAILGDTSVLLPRLGAVLIVAIPVMYLSQKLLLEIRLERLATGEATRRSRLLETVAQSSQRVSRLDVGMVDEVLDSAISLGFDIVDVCVQGAGGSWRIEASRQHDHDVYMPAPDSVASGLSDLERRGSATFLRAAEDADVLSDPLKRLGLGTLMVNPLGSEGDATVALRCAIKLGSELTATQAECVEKMLAGNATIALHNKRLVGELRAMQGQLRHDALHDALTGLSNRIDFNDTLDEALFDCQRNPRRFAVMFIDLDRFKPVNDSLGHDVGNELLISVARRLTAAVRETDMVARIGGDEFVVLLDPVFDNSEDTELVEIADRVCSAISDPFNVSGNEVVISCSVGIAMADVEVKTGAELLRRADLAMYRAKSLGKARWERYEADLDEQAVTRSRLEADMRHAIADNQIGVEYQGIVSIRSGQTVGVETLLRWKHPVRGLISPEVLIELAEDSGLIIALGQRVLEHACSQASEWQKMLPEQPPLVAVNVSPFQLFHPRFFETLDEVLADTGVDPTGLVMEITENIVGVDADTEAALYKLKERGLLLALDDFGRGQASLLFLQNFPIDILKIDKTFVQHGDSDHAGRAILRSVIGLAHDLGLVVVAEGIETRSQLKLLSELGCDLAQGFLLSKSVPAAQATEALTQSNRGMRPRSTTSVTT